MDGGNSKENALLEAISAARQGQLNTQGIATLAKEMAASGQTLTHIGKTADVASTGGPSSLSTLLCPLFLRLAGFAVPKLGVPGRPAGGIDVLSRIPNYRIRLSTEGVSAILERCGYAHFVAGEMIAPLDAELFALRQRVGAQAVPSLVVASLLSKKIAVGVRRAGLDVRVAPHGNFGSNFETARKNARLYCRVALALEIEARCILTDATRPYQPYIGRGESLLALSRLFAGRAEPWLQRHADACTWMADVTIGADPDPKPTRSLYATFADNVEAQGGSLDGFESTANDIAEGHKITLCAPRSGFPCVDLNRLRHLITARQSQRGEDGDYPDPAGVILLMESDRLVAKGDPIMTVRASSTAREFSEEAGKCINMLETPPTTVGEPILG
ncbi:MAG: hypothetical protein JSR91_18375 [Proteobacteria bacterium]|nr:hypothetical protein [Pseudomonadota bacterium]